MANFWIMPSTFGGQTHFVHQMRMFPSTLAYETTEVVVRLYFAWENSLEPYESISGVIADAMTEAADVMAFTTDTHRLVWFRVRDYMRARNTGERQPDMPFYAPAKDCRAWLGPLEKEMIEAKTKETQ